MCGKKVPRTQRVMVDGVILNLCDSCSRFGKPVDVKPETVTVKYTAPKSNIQYIPRKNTTVRRNSRPPRKPKTDLDSVEVSPEYPEIVREAREHHGWTHEELALKLLEKKNLVAKIERGELRPSVKLARKLEKLLDIKLVESI